MASVRERMWSAYGLVCATLAFKGASSRHYSPRPRHSAARLRLLIMPETSLFFFTYLLMRGLIVTPSFAKSHYIRSDARDVNRQTFI